MEEELKPCPYCGDAMPTVSRVGKCHTVECGCGMTGPYGDEPAEAIAAWNSLPRRSDIERMERERDWLAEKLEENAVCCLPENEECGCSFCSDCGYCTYEGWLNAAKEATHGV